MSAASSRCGVALWQRAALSVAALACLAASACAPQLLVVHEDPYHPVADIWVDGKRAGRVSHGDSMSVRLARGPHVLRAIAPGEAESPWTRPAKELRLIMDRRATLRLLPMPVEAR